MLELMRRQAGNWMIKVLLGAIALAFALSWGVYNYGDRAREVELTVNGEPITASQISEEEYRLKEQLKAQLGDQVEKHLSSELIREQATNQLVQNILLFQAAAQMGVQVADSEVASRVAAEPAFSKNGQFNLERYKRVLSRNRMTPEQFEASQRSRMIMEKLEALVAGSAQVSPQEVRQTQLLQLSKVAGAYKLFKLDDFMDKVKISDQELKDYYEANQALYMVPEQVVLKYLTFPVADFRDQTDVVDEDVRELYEIDAAKYSQKEKVRAHQIFIPLAADATPEAQKAAKEKVEKIMAQLKEGADFSELAKKYSQGPAAKTGGDLGELTPGVLVPELDKPIFDMKPGKPALVKSKFGLHIIKVDSHTPASVTPLEKVQSKIREELVERQAKDLASVAAERAFDMAATGVTAAELAKQLKRSLETSPQLTPKSGVEGLKGLKGLPEALVDLRAGEVMPPLFYDGGAVLIFLDKRIAAKPKPFEEVKELVRGTVQEKKADALAEQAARKLIAKLKGEAKPAQTLLAMEGAKETGLQGKQGAIEGLTASRNLIRDLFLTPLDHPVVEKPVALGDDYAVAVIMERKAPSDDELKKNADEFRDRLLMAKRSSVLQRFVTDLRARAEIKVPAKM